MKSVLTARHFRFSVRLFVRFRRSRSGVAATEFALLLPVMLTIWIGMIVGSDAFIASRKVTLLTRTLADMTTQMQAVSQSDLDSIFQATQAVMWPKAPTKMGMRVTSFDIDSAGKVFVDWSSVPTNGALATGFAAFPRCSQQSPLVPNGLKVPRTSIVYAEVKMLYQASVATQIVDELFKESFKGGELPLSDVLFMRSRQSNKVQFNPPPGGNCPGYAS